MAPDLKPIMFTLLPSHSVFPAELCSPVLLLHDILKQQHVYKQADTQAGAGRALRKAARLQHSACFHGMNVLLHVPLPAGCCSSLAALGCSPAKKS